MAKVKKVSISTFDKIVKETYIADEIVVWHDTEITIKKTLSLKEMMTFVTGVSKSCFTIDDGTYIPEVKDFIIKSYIIDMYTNLSLPDNSEHKYNLIYCSDIIETILQHVNGQQFNEICLAIKEKVGNIAQANVEMVYKQLNELYSSFDALQDKLASVFSGINEDDMSKLVSAISNGKLDEDKIVKAYIDQTTTVQSLAKDVEE